MNKIHLTKFSTTSTFKKYSINSKRMEILKLIGQGWAQHNTEVNGERLKAFPPKTGAKTTKNVFPPHFQKQ